MRVLLVNTSEHTGGAAIAASRLMKALHSQGVEAEMLVNKRESENPKVHALPGKLLQKIRFVAERLGIVWANRGSRKNLFAIITLLLIATLSLIPAQEFPKVDVQFADKWAHWVMYAFLFLVISGERIIRKRTTHFPSFILIAILVSIYGGLMELGQAYLTTEIGWTLPPILMVPFVV